MVGWFKPLDSTFKLGKNWRAWALHRYIDWLTVRESSRTFGQKDSTEIYSFLLLRPTDITVTSYLISGLPSHIFYGIPRGEWRSAFRLEAWKIKQSYRDSIRHAAEPAEPADWTSNIRIRDTAGHPGDPENQSLRETDQETNVKIFRQLIHDQ